MKVSDDLLLKPRHDLLRLLPMTLS